MLCIYWLIELVLYKWKKIIGLVFENKLSYYIFLIQIISIFHNIIINNIKVMKSEVLRDYFPVAKKYNI